MAQHSLGSHEIARLRGPLLLYDVDMRSDRDQDLLEKAVKAAARRKAFPTGDSCFIMDGDVLVLIFDRKAVRDIRERPALSKPATPLPSGAAASAP